MRALLIGFLALATLGYGQSNGGAFKPDATFVFREHSIGADMVEITMSRADYPPELLRRQVEELGRLIDSPPRGLAVGKVQLDPANPALEFVKARFAVDGIIDRPAGVLRLEPVLKAFAGAPEPQTLRTFLILFDGERPGPKTIQNHDSDALEAKGTFIAAPPMIEYRVVLKSQNPNEISFPDRAPEQTPPKKPSEQNSGTPVLFWVAVSAAGLAAGALVYLALLRGGAGSPVRR